MQQSNALRKLEEILTEAVADGDRSRAAGPILLKAMKLSEQVTAKDLVDFYELLNKAEEEAKSIRNKPRINRYLQTLDELHEIFIVNSVWNEAWKTFAIHIERGGVLNTLDALADFFYFQSPTRLLEQDFLEKLNDEFKELLDKVVESNLTKELKRFLIERIEDIQKAIRRYHIDGTEGLEKSAKSLVSDLVMAEHSLEDEDRNNSAYKQVKAWVLTFLIYITPSPYDIIGAVPDIHDFWKPKFEELAAGCKKVEQIIDERSTIQEAFEKAVNIFDRYYQKSIAGKKEIKALPASKENLEATTDKDNKSGS